jgi:hypothetical protein
MPGPSYVVRLVGSDEPQPFKHFRSHETAVGYASESVKGGQAERADIYRVPNEIDPRPAVEAVKTGAADLIECRSARPSDAETYAAWKKAWDEAVKQGPDAMLKLLGLK